MAAKTDKSSVTALRARIAARRQERKAEEANKYAKMREAAKSPEKLDKTLQAVVAKTNKLAAGLENMIDWLDLVHAPKNAALAVKVAASRNYAKGLMKFAMESPEMLADALQEAYKSLDELAAGLEMAAMELGVDLQATPIEEAFAEEGLAELEHGEAEGEAMVEEGEMPSFEKAEEPAAEEESEEPSFEKGDEEEAKDAADGSAGFVTDRGEDAQPRTPQRMKVPRVDGGDAQTSVNASDGSASAESFVKDIPQSQGKTETGAGKSGAQNKPMKQIVEGGTPSAPAAAEFVKEIPQSQGKTETGAGKKSSYREKIGAVLTSIIKKALSRKDYIMIADAIRETPMSPEQKKDFAARLCGPLSEDNPRFDEQTFINYCAGTGPSRPKRKKMAPPQPQGSEGQDRESYSDIQDRKSYVPSV
jgi:hypothetical protein